MPAALLITTVVRLASLVVLAIVAVGLVAMAADTIRAYRRRPHHAYCHTCRTHHYGTARTNVAWWLEHDCEDYQ